MENAPVMETHSISGVNPAMEETATLPQTPTVSTDPELDHNAPSIEEVAAFSLSGTPPVAEDLNTTEPEQDETGTSHHPDQTSLMDMVETAPQNQEAAEEDMKGEETASDQDKSPDEPFILGKTVEITDPEPEPSSAQGNGSLISHISRMFTGKSAATSDTAPPKEKSADTSPREPVLSAVTRAETAPSDQPAESGISSLKPTTQNQLDMPQIDEEDDLEIPAFLRRQAN